MIALLDYGPEPIEFGSRVPLGVNMAFRRRPSTRRAFDPQTGRRAGTLLGQEVREWCIRARGVPGSAASTFPSWRCVTSSPRPAEQGLLPALVLLARHQPGAALRAVGLDMEAPEQARRSIFHRPAPARGAAIPVSQGVPRARRLAARRGRRAAVEAFEHELWLCFFAGIVRQRWTDRPARAAGCGPGTFLPTVMERRPSAEDDLGRPQIDRAMARPQRPATCS